MNEPVIIGGGVAGLLVALHMAPEPVILLTGPPQEESTASAWAQGGIAAAIGTDDSPSLHLADTLAAGAGLCDIEVARRITDAAPAAIDTLRYYGVRFDATLGREAAHSRRRIVHAQGDGTGREIMRALRAAVAATPSIRVWRGVAERLVVSDGALCGVDVCARAGVTRLATSRVVIATGGLSSVYIHSTNPVASTGRGLAMALRAGAALADMEFVQFHPTALACDASPLPLISEAVRGEGATLIDEDGARFMADVPGAELAARDVVSRAVWAHMGRGHRVFLDARALATGFADEFPSVAAICRAAGIDPATQPIPVRPAAHYAMGGIAVGPDGRSTVAGLWACGEAACTGLHGANRLASNSLLEAAVSAQWVARDVAGSVSRTVMPRGSAGPSDTPHGRADDDAFANAAGILRHADALEVVARKLAPVAAVDDLAAVRLMIAVAALHRSESRGAHARTDYPATDPAWARHVCWTLREARDAAMGVGSEPLARCA